MLFRSSFATAADPAGARVATVDTAATLAGAGATRDAWTDAEVRRLLADATRAHAAVAAALWRADGATELATRAAAILARGDAVAVGELAVTGKDLMAALEMPPGPQLGRLLAALLDRAFDDPSLNQRDALIATARGLELELAR